MRNAIVNEEGSKQRFCRRLEMFLKTIIKAKTNKELFGAKCPQCLTIHDSIEKS